MNKLCCLGVVCVSSILAAAQSAGGVSVNDLVKKAEAGDAQAQLDLGLAYDEGKGMPQNDELAANWYRKSAEQGNALAQNNLGVLYRTGRGLARDREEAARWFAKAALQCQPNAAYNLGIAYYNGDGVVRDAGLGFIWLLVAKQCGNMQVQSAMDQIASEMKIQQRQTAGSKFIKYVAATPDFKPDVGQLFQQMAKLNPPLAVDICRAYARPEARWHDNEKAETWCQQALSMKFGDVRETLGQLAEERGDFARALKMYNEAAKSYSSVAPGRLGILYLEGKGTNPDAVKAYFWLYMAVKEYSQAKLQPQLELASQQISPKERSKQEKRVHEKLHSLH